MHLSIRVVIRLAEKFLGEHRAILVDEEFLGAVNADEKTDDVAGFPASTATRGSLRLHRFGFPRVPTGHDLLSHRRLILVHVVDGPRPSSG